MDIRELLEQRKREIYGDADVVVENLGDITDDMEYLGDITEEGFEVKTTEDLIMTESEYFTEAEIQEIELEATQIEDAENYMDSVLADSREDILQFVGECYIDELILEEALFDCETVEELEAVEESIKEAAGRKKDAAIAKVKELWKKFKAWILNLKDVIVNQFTSGNKLISKYKYKIISEYKKRGDKIKVKTYKYKFDDTAIREAVAALEVTFEEFVGTGKKLNKKDVNKAYEKQIGGKEGGNKGLKEKAAACVRDKEKKEYKVSELDINTIMAIAGESKSAIKALKEFNKAEDDFFKQRIQEIKNSAAPSDDKNGGVKKDVISSQVSAAKRGAAMGTALIKYYIAELKSANRACLAIVRRLLNQSTSGGETETKLHKKIDEKRSY